MDVQRTSSFADASECEAAVTALCELPATSPVADLLALRMVKSVTVETHDGARIVYSVPRGCDGGTHVRCGVPSRRHLTDHASA